MSIKAPDLKIKGIESRVIRKRKEIVSAVDSYIKNAEHISKRNYLSGPRPEKLGVVTGHLRSSVRGTVQDSNIIRGILSAGPLPYAAIHELGGMAGRGRKVRIKARPYLKPALETVLPLLKAKITQLIGDIDG
jgi:phage gpG-like protein